MFKNILQQTLYPLNFPRIMRGLFSTLSQVRFADIEDKVSFTMRRLSGVTLGTTFVCNLLV